MKKLDKLLLRAFAGPFLMTFLVVVFILLTVHMLKYFDDIIGKGLPGEIVGQLLFYYGVLMTPSALPLAVLLSSLITFGNLAEHFELTAIKSAGISLVRTLRPIFIVVLVLTCVAFYVNNNLVPKAALEAYSLLYDIRQKKPALELREGAFYGGIPDISIKVDKKFADGITLGNVVIYDHRNATGNTKVTVADSGRMYTIMNERLLKFELFRGYNYAENDPVHENSERRNGSLTQSKFAKSHLVFDLSSFDLSATNKMLFQGHWKMRNLRQLQGDIDSVLHKIVIHLRGHNADHALPYTKQDTEESLSAARKPFAYQPERSSKHKLPESPGMSVVDSLFYREPSNANYHGAAHHARQMKTRIENANQTLDKLTYDLNAYTIQWHKIIANSLACVAMFLIGAPLGAIIKKGGLGMPFLVSIIFFIAYYVLTMQGEKLAIQKTISVEVGVWMADGVLFLFGLLCVRQARADARLFDADFYRVVGDIIRKRCSRKKPHLSVSRG